MKRDISPINDLLAFWRIFRFLRKEKPTIVHTHCSKAGILGRWAALLAGVPIIVHTPHGHIYSPGRFNFGRLKTVLLLLLERLTARFTDYLFFLTDVERAESLSLGILRRDAKSGVVHSGVEIEKFGDVCNDVSEKKAEFRLPAEAKVVGTVGRLVPLKGHRYFIDCLPFVLPVFPNARFLIVGDGPLRAELEKQARRLGVERNVIFTGLRRDVPEIIPCLSLFVLSSTHEAMAAGKPVVATRVGGVESIVSDGITGILVPPASPSALAAAILKLLTDQKRAEKMGERGKMRATAFSAEAMVNTIMFTYLSLIQLKGDSNGNPYH